MLFLVSVLQNLALLSFIGLGLLAVDRQGLTKNVRTRAIFLGVVLGVATTLATTKPIVLSSGLSLEMIVGPMLAAAAIAGPFGSITAALVATTGTIGASGMASVPTLLMLNGYALLGWLLAISGRITSKNLSEPRCLLALCVSSCIPTTCVFFLFGTSGIAHYSDAQVLLLTLVAGIASVLLTVLCIAIASRMIDSFLSTQARIETFRLAKRAGQFGIWDYDIAADKLEWDDQSAEIHGVSPSRKPRTFTEWSRLVNPVDLEVVERRFAIALEGSSEFETEYRTQIPGRPEKIVRGLAVLLYGHNKKPLRVVGTNFDMTETRATERALREAQNVAAQSRKYETIGKLTGGIAHDFNNLLAVIMGNQDLLLEEIVKDYGPNTNAASYAKASIKAVRRGASLTKSMLAYAQQAQLVPIITDMNEIVLKIEKRMRDGLNGNIEILTCLQQAPWCVYVDRSWLESALINLIQNSRDAMPTGGKLTLETRNIWVPSATQSPKGDHIPSGKYVSVSISDTGPGISPLAMEKVFEPFFTTKAVGQGTGLGLSMVDGFVRQTGGTIRIDSEPGRGTCVTLSFSAVEN